MTINKKNMQTNKHEGKERKINHMKIKDKIQEPKFRW